MRRPSLSFTVNANVKGLFGFSIVFLPSSMPTRWKVAFCTRVPNWSMLYAMAESILAADSTGVSKGDMVREHDAIFFLVLELPRSDSPFTPLSCASLSMQLLLATSIT
jgi:hypothetical protein